MEERNSASPIIALLYMWNFKEGKNAQYLVHYGKEDDLKKDLHPTYGTQTPPQRGEGLGPSASPVSHLYFPSSFLNRKECSLPFLFLFFFPFQSNVPFLIKSLRKFILSLKRCPHGIGLTYFSILDWPIRAAQYILLTAHAMWINGGLLPLPNVGHHYHYIHQVYRHWLLVQNKKINLTLAT